MIAEVLDVACWEMSSGFDLNPYDSIENCQYFILIISRVSHNIM